MTQTTYLASAILWSLGIVVAYSLPGSALPAPPDLIGWDKVAHFGLFAGFGFLWMRVLHPLRDGDPRATVPRRMLGFLAISLCLAAGGEVYQSFLPERTPDPYDAIANALGVCTTVFLFRWRHPPTPSRRATSSS